MRSEVHSLPAGNLFDRFGLRRIIGIAADADRRDPGGKGQFGIGGERVITRGAASSHAGASNSSAASAKDSDLATCRVLYQILHHQGGLSGGDRKELLKAEVGLLVGHVEIARTTTKGTLKLWQTWAMAVASISTAIACGKLWRIFARPTEPLMKASPLTMRPRTALRSNALMQLSAAATSFSSALKPAGQPGSWPYS